MTVKTRFAPSPTGLLHIGSLLTALASYADARANRGKWLVRMEDLDPPREMPAEAVAWYSLPVFRRPFPKGRLKT